MLVENVFSFFFFILPTKLTQHFCVWWAGLFYNKSKLFPLQQNDSFNFNIPQHFSDSIYNQNGNKGLPYLNMLYLFRNLVDEIFTSRKN